MDIRKSLKCIIHDTKMMQLWRKIEEKNDANKTGEKK